MEAAHWNFDQGEGLEAGRECHLKQKTGEIWGFLCFCFLLMPLTGKPAQQSESKGLEMYISMWVGVWIEKEHIQEYTARDQKRLKSMVNGEVTEKDVLTFLPGFTCSF